VAFRESERRVRAGIPDSQKDRRERNARRQKYRWREVSCIDRTDRIKGRQIENKKETVSEW
jgi:hypothetical protein